MSLSIDEVTKVAKLARIRFSKEELENLNKDLNGIMHWIDSLQQINTEGVEIYTERQHQPMPEREDIVCEGICVDDILMNAPESAHGMFAVPKVVE